VGLAVGLAAALAQIAGFCLPEIVGLTLEHTDVAGPSGPWYAISMSLMSTSVHGSWLLQARVTAACVEEVPRILLKLTLLIFIWDGA